jgi:anti-sigma factor RsiW
MSLDDKDLSALIRRHATRHAAPDSLRAGIRTQAALAEAGRTADTQTPQPAKPSRHRWLVVGRGTASAGFVLGMLCMALLLPLAQRFMPSGPQDADFVAGHVRALQTGLVAEVASTDRHTVKPWFQGRLDYAPPVIDLAGDGFPLIGGRIEHLRGNAVATLAYSRNRHVIHVFVWPGSEERPLATRLHRGFNVSQWADGAMQYAIVSDVERADADAFARLWQQRSAAK